MNMFVRSEVSTEEYVRQPLPPNRPKGPSAVRLYDLTGKSCRFPVGDDEGWEQWFCGEVQAPGSSYCPACAKLARYGRAKAVAA